MTLKMLDVLIGIVAVYLVFSSVVSMLAELAESWLQRRSRLLERAIAQMFAPLAGTAPDPKAAEAALAAFWNSPAVFALYDGVRGQPGCRLPSAIPPERFAAALRELASGAQTAAQFAPIASRILAIYGLDLAARAEDIEDRLRRYYEDSMQRVSGWYRRHVQAVLAISGIGLAALMNVDTLAILRELSANDALRAQLVSAAQAQTATGAAPLVTVAAADCSDPASAACESARRAAFDAALERFGGYGLPLGWSAVPPPREPCRNAADARQGCSLPARLAHWIGDDPLRALEKLAGLLLTGLAAALGAPYWFEWLQRLLAVRRAVGGVSAPVAEQPDDVKPPVATRRARVRVKPPAA